MKMKKYSRNTGEICTEGMYRLLGAIIGSALVDLYRDIPYEIERLKQHYYKKNGIEFITKKQQLYIDSAESKLLYEKGTAEQFFKSEWFQMMNISFDYLVEHKEEIISANKQREESLANFHY